MLKLVVLISLLGLTLGLPAELPYDEYDPRNFDPEDPPITTNYHETIGIPEAARIKAAEEATTFDGSRIVGGSAASLGAYPHLGGLVITLTDGRTSVCGSSLISNNRAVTAAHCWSDGTNQARQFEVVLGSVALFSGGTRIVTNQVIMHENWNPRTIQNDVAVIILGWVNYSNTIRNIGLASGSQDYVGTWAWAAGFGVQRDGQGIQSNQQLHHAQLQVISNVACQRFFGSSIAAQHLCIDGSQRRSTCGGDSGGPLQIAGPTLIGITSFGFRLGCERGWPAAFARVTTFESWIRARM